MNDKFYVFHGSENPSLSIPLVILTAALESTRKWYGELFMVFSRPAPFLHHAYVTIDGSNVPAGVFEVDERYLLDELKLQVRTFVKLSEARQREQIGYSAGTVGISLQKKPPSDVAHFWLGGEVQNELIRVSQLTNPSASNPI